VTVVETGPDRLASLREAAGDMDEALRNEGFDAFGSHAVFVRWQRASVEALGAILVEAEGELGARVEKACAMIEESSRKFRDDEVRRVEVMLESGRVAINLAREANQTALVTADRAEQEFNKSVGRIAEEMSRKLLAESQKWLVLKQTERNRRGRGDWPVAWPPRLWRCSLAAPPRCNGGVRRRARRAKPCSKRSTAVGLSQGSCGWRMEKPLKCVGLRI
jgi:hypothetical protein